MQNTTDYQVELVFIRHGKTKGNEERRYIGVTDENLSQKGLSELGTIKGMYKSQDRVFTSPMKRCMETAQVLFGTADLTVIQNLREMNFGTYEGKNYEDLSADAYYQKWIDSNGELPFPGGESKEQFVKRSMDGMRTLLNHCESHMTKFGTSDMHVAAVVHGGTIMAVLSSMYEGDYYDYQVPCGFGYKCSLIQTGGDWYMKQVSRIDDSCETYEGAKL